MKTISPKYTLIVVDLLWGDTQPAMDNPPSLEGLLAKIPDSALEVGRGMFLFDTLKDYSSIHHLRQGLLSANRVVLTLPIEEELHVVCDNAKAKAIADKFPSLRLYRIAHQS